MIERPLLTDFELDALLHDAELSLKSMDDEPLGEDAFWLSSGRWYEGVNLALQELKQWRRNV